MVAALLFLLGLLWTVLRIVLPAIVVVVIMTQKLVLFVAEHSLGPLKRAVVLIALPSATCILQADAVDLRIAAVCILVIVLSIGPDDKLLLPSRVDPSSIQPGT